MQTLKIFSQGFGSQTTKKFGDFTLSFGRVRLRKVKNARAELLFLVIRSECQVIDSKY